MRNKRPAMRNIGIELDPKTIQLWNNYNGINIELIQADAAAYLKSYQFTGDELVYCDPPYLRETRKKHKALYKYEYTYEQHVELLKAIKSLPCMVMISGYKSLLYEELLEDWNTYSFKAGCHNGTATEYIWMNYPSPVQLHDYRYLGDTFRERERLKRITKNMIRRFRTMPVLKRRALLLAINSSCGSE